MKTLKSVCLHRHRHQVFTGRGSHSQQRTCDGGVMILHHEVEVGHYRSLPPPVFRLIRLGVGEEQEEGWSCCPWRGGEAGGAGPFGLT